MQPSTARERKIEDIPTAELVDELGPIQEELDRVAAFMKPTEKRAEAIEKELKRRVESADATKLKGDRYFALVGEKNNSTSIDNMAVVKLLSKSHGMAAGRTLFIETVSLGLEKLKALLPATWESCVTQTRSGSRTVVAERYPSQEVTKAA